MNASNPDWKGFELIKMEETDAGEAEKGEYQKLREARIAANQAELARIFGQ